MRKARFAFVALFVLTVLAIQVPAQDKPRTDSKPPATTLKVQVTFAENEGEKKLANLPYTFFLKAADLGPNSPWTKVRMGSRVPVATGDDKGTIQFQYIDVGTNIDARGLAAEDGKFDLTLNLERSWVEGEVRIPTVNNAEAGRGQFSEPVIRQFKTELTLTMRDGQTIQTTQAADPLSGRILTISVTMNVVK